MIYTCEEYLTDFKFWSGGEENAKLLTYSELQELDEKLQDYFSGTPTQTNINDLFWFDFDTVCNLIGLTEDEVRERGKDENQ